jgi:hypothetical protein
VAEELARQDGRRRQGDRRLAAPGCLAPDIRRSEHLSVHAWQPLRSPKGLAPHENFLTIYQSSVVA